MSYQQFQQECGDCHKRWNASFGIVGTTQIAAPPTKCPHCGSGNLIKIADRWADIQTLSVTAYCQGCADSERKLSCAAKTITELQKECNALREQLLLVRKILWLGHGHEGLYRDDGEMQCNIGGCMIDFKREPLEEIVANLLKQSVAQRDELRSQNAKLQSKLARQPLPLPPTYVRCMGGHYYAETRGDEDCPTCEQLKALRERNAELEEQHELSGQAYLVVVNELRKTQAERDRDLSELAEARQLLQELHEFNECALCYDDGECKFADAIDAARAVIPAEKLASSEVERDADSPVLGGNQNADKK